MKFKLPFSKLTTQLTVGFPVALLVFSGHPTLSRAGDTTNKLHARKQAVSDRALSIYGVGGINESGGLIWAGAQFVTPLSENAGFQIDGRFGGFNARFEAQLNAHLFQRDPDLYLIGAYTSWSHADISRYNRDIGRIGIEGELYLRDFTLSSVAGYEFGGEKNVFFNQTRVSYYLDERLKLYAGYIFENDRNVGLIGSEYLLSDAARTSVFGEARFGESGTNSAWAGMKVVFGNRGDKALKARDREDFAPVWNHIVSTRDRPTAVPTSEPTPTPTPQPTQSVEPTLEPTPEPTPSVAPTSTPTAEPTPSLEPTPTPTPSPTSSGTLDNNLPPLF
ncbi:hypothetical protein [Brucella pituitosa]|uniref:hypothetical protein n=1 Tax=Brucella pituitosa TaxID=571256 RepID=UPI0012603647|nr:hypothetical protein [Brucella pituitosa]